MKDKKNILFVIVLIIVGGVSFLGGKKLEQQKMTKTGGSRNFATSQIPRMRQDGDQGNPSQGGGFRQNIGEIISLDDKSITIKTADGGSKIIFISDSTTINKSIEGNKSDLEVGENIMVIGDNNSDGSITATSVELNPRMPNPTTTEKKE